MSIGVFLSATKRDFGVRLAAARKARGLTQAELGQLVSRSQKQISEWESGLSEPEDLETMGIVASAVEATYGWLAAGEGTPPKGVVPAPAGGQPIVVGKAKSRLIDPKELEKPSTKRRA